MSVSFGSRDVNVVEQLGGAQPAAGSTDTELSVGLTCRASSIVCSIVLFVVSADVSRSLEGAEDPRDSGQDSEQCETLNSTHAWSGRGLDSGEEHH